MSELRSSIRQAHGPKKAYYNLLPDNKPHPVFQCLCGFFSDLIFDTWEEAGKSLDTHIAASLRKEDQAYHEALNGKQLTKAATR